MTAGRKQVGSAPIVVALGGNAISPAGEDDTIPRQFQQTRRTASFLAHLLVNGTPVAITHGNGPQIGAALRRIELAAHEVYVLPLGICVADLQGGMGYMITQCINNELIRHGHPRSVATIVTSVEVDPDDPAFERPTKPIGPLYDAERAARMRDVEGWNMVEITGGGFRRVVPSPTPRAIVEIDLLRALLAAGQPIITAGGGGIPVVRDPDGTLSGREAVIDKDLASGLLAREIDAETLVIVTEVECVYLGYGRPDQRTLGRLTAAEARRHLEAGEFPPGSMGPKIRAAVEFLDGSGRPGASVVISNIEQVADAMAGTRGTTITRD